MLSFDEWIALKRMGGGQEFQEDIYHDLPPNLWIGPAPATHSQPGSQTPDGAPSDNLAGASVSAPSQSVVDRLSSPWRELLFGIQRKGNYIQTFGTVGTQAVLVRLAEARTYFIVQNTSLANNLFVGVGYGPTIAPGGATGFLLLANGGNYEPQVIPQQDIWLLGSAPGTSWVMAVATG